MPTGTKKKTTKKKNSSRTPTVNVLRAEAFAKLPWVAHGFSTRSGGISKAYGGRSLNLGFTAHDSKAAVQRNRDDFTVALIGDVKRPDVKKDNVGRRAPRTFAHKPWPLIGLRQIHSDIIHRITELPSDPLAGDGMVTDVPGILLGVMTADCLPIILVDSKRHAVGVFHAGWRGTAKRIAQKGVGEMHRWFGSDPRDLKAAIGPGIRGCCYEVGPEVKATFEAQFSYGSALLRETKEQNEIHEKYPLLFLTARAPGHSELPKKIFLDLAEANRRQLIDAGVPAKNISDLGMCTSCRTDVFFSHRKEKGATGRMMAAVGIRN